MAETDVLDDVVATSPEGLREQALRRLKKRRELHTHAFAYVTVNVLLWGVWAIIGATAHVVPVAVVGDPGLGHRARVQRVGRLLPPSDHRGRLGARWSACAANTATDRYAVAPNRARAGRRPRRRPLPRAAAPADPHLGRDRGGGHSRLPGDELLEGADGVATRAIAIDAPAGAVWPWLAQMGPSPRGGAYTYDWIENLLGLDMHSVDHVLPEFQHPQVGDTIGYGSNLMRVARVEPGRVLASRSQDGNWVWTFVLEEHDGTTRLISRNRFRLPTLAAARRDAADGARLAGDGAQDAARDQAARRAARGLELGSAADVVDRQLGHVV